MPVKLISLVLMCAALMANAMADDAMPLAFNVIYIKERPLDNKDIKIAVKEQKNGVFVLAASGSGGKLPNTTKLIRDMMAAKGIKVADGPATADVGLQFANIAGFSIGDIESHASTIDGGKIGAGIGAVIGRDIFGLSGKLKARANQPVTAMFSVLSADKPSVTASNKLDGEKKTSILSTMQYQAYEAGTDVLTAAFVAFIDDFIKYHFVFDTPVSTVPVIDTPVSAVSAIDTPVSAKPASSVAAAPSLDAASAVTGATVVSDVK